MSEQTPLKTNPVANFPRNDPSSLATSFNLVRRYQLQHFFFGHLEAGRQCQAVEHPSYIAEQIRLPCFVNKYILLGHTTLSLSYLAFHSKCTIRISILHRLFPHPMPNRDPTSYSHHQSQLATCLICPRIL